MRRVRFVLYTGSTPVHPLPEFTLCKSTHFSQRIDYGLCDNERDFADAMN